MCFRQLSACSTFNWTAFYDDNELELAENPSRNLINKNLAHKMLKCIRGFLIISSTELWPSQMIIEQKFSGASVKPSSLAGGKIYRGFSVKSLFDLSAYWRSYLRAVSLWRQIAKAERKKPLVFIPLRGIFYIAARNQIQGSLAAISFEKGSRWKGLLFKEIPLRRKSTAQSCRHKTRNLIEKFQFAEQISSRISAHRISENSWLHRLN